MGLSVGAKRGEVVFYTRVIAMRGYCPKCQEYRSDKGEDAWGIEWTDYGTPLCERCGHTVDFSDMIPNCRSEKGKVQKKRRG